jgi:DNA-binding response OmpR family regulator
MDTVAGSEPQILLVEDDSGLAAMVSDSLRARRYSVWHASSALDAQAAVDAVRPDVIVLDLMLPDANGLTLCSELKRRAAAPVIICSATRRKDDAVIGFQLGADDFVRKPFTIDELQARIDLALRRGATPSPVRNEVGKSVQRVGTLTIDLRGYEATVEDRPLPLTPTEFRILATLATRSPDVVSRHELAEPIWQTVDDAVIRTLDVHVRRLRAKLHSAALYAPRIVARRGFGYQLTPAAVGPLS